MIENEPCEKTIPINEGEQTLRDENNELKTLFKDALQSNTDFQTMMLEMFKECIQNVNTTNNNTTNNNNSHNTNNINYYLNVTCQNAETDLEFLEQWKEKCVEMFHEKKLLIAERKVNFGHLCDDIYLKLIKNKPQTERFIQTTNWKDGKVYVNTAELDENKNPTGEKKFVQHTDGLKELTNFMSHALGKCIYECANREVEDKYFEENRKFNISSLLPTTPEIEWKRDMSGGLMMAACDVYNAMCDSNLRNQLMKATIRDRI